MEQLFIIFEIIGTMAFSVSGAFVALEKKMDIFGVAILGLTTAIGGGVFRDLILGITPPNTFENPIYAVIAICVSIIVFIPSVGRTIRKKKIVNDMILLVMDSLGLGIFTVVGVKAAFMSGFEENVFLQIFVGVVTGVGGGILRDIMAGNKPYVFVKHFYACASLLGAICCVVLWRFTDGVLAMLAGAVITLILRICAAKFHWSLPKAE